MANDKTKKIELANKRLEESFVSKKRLIKEDDTKSNLINQVIQMDRELDNNETYKKYEKLYAADKIKKMISTSFGIDADQIPDDMIQTFMTLGGEVSKMQLTPDMVMKHKDSVKDTVSNIMALANQNGEHELSGKLQEFLNLLNQL